MALIWGNGGLNIRFHDRDLENACAFSACALRGTACFGIFCVKIDLVAMAAASCKNPPKKRKNGKKLAE